MKLTEPSTIKELMQRHSIAFQKRFGQNFLINESIIERIADAGITDDITGALEIGPGIGTLTRALCERAERVLAVEIDQGLIPVLDETLADYDNVTVINEDFMKLDVNSTLDAHLSGLNIGVCANLPYYITTPIIMSLLESRAAIDSITVMLQKEVAERFCATPNSADYGAITVSLAYYGKVERLFNVSAGNFMPKPNVDSAVIRIRRMPSPPVSDEELLFRIIKGAFAQRRKTLINTLSSYLSLPKSELAAAMAEVGIPEKCRGEELDLKSFCELTDSISKIV